ncbi:UNVERIFIED_CONTAM: Steroid 17-alpha-hydroxylase/17,20 lyase [Trichonephila clavipes]
MPCDFFLRGILRTLVTNLLYFNPLSNIKNVALQTNDGTMLQNVWHELDYRLDVQRLQDVCINVVVPCKDLIWASFETRQISRRYSVCVHTRTNISLVTAANSFLIHPCRSTRSREFEIKFFDNHFKFNYFSDDMLMINVLDIFSAGSETVRTTILWFVYSMAAFPDVQKKIQQEILEVIGTERNPEFLDLKSMPYTHAVLLEQMRWKTIVPLNLIHYSLGDTKVGGYDIPKDTMVIANFWQAHNDPRYWDEPEKFKPERFLSKDGTSVVKSKYFMGFSSGKFVSSSHKKQLFITNLLTELSKESLMYFSNHSILNINIGEKHRKIPFTLSH